MKWKMKWYNELNEGNILLTNRNNNNIAIACFISTPLYWSLILEWFEISKLLGVWNLPLKSYGLGMQEHGWLNVERVQNHITHINLKCIKGSRKIGPLTVGQDSPSFFGNMSLKCSSSTPLFLLSSCHLL